MEINIKIKFPSFYDIQNYIFNWKQSIRLFFRKPKYKIGQTVYYYGVSSIVEQVYKDYYDMTIQYLCKSSRTLRYEGDLHEV
jgi:hypothetical protein